MSYTITIQQQQGLNIIGVGAAGQVYEIDENIVLKSGRVYKPPEDNASGLDMWRYASDSIFHFELIEQERTIYKLLQSNPHPNLAEPVDTSYAEGIYLRRYKDAQKPNRATRAQRISLYLDLLRGLNHLHQLKIAHSDLRFENILFNSVGQAVICDFSASASFGAPNPAAPSPGNPNPIPINGPADHVSDATDRFSLASLMFFYEVGTKPLLFVREDGSLLLPQFTVPDTDIGSIITRAWKGEFASTTDMLQHVQSLSVQKHLPDRQYTVPVQSLRLKVSQWRTQRLEKYGKRFPNLAPTY